jgi:hypothetical protein
MAWSDLTNKTIKNFGGNFGNGNRKRMEKTWGETGGRLKRFAFSPINFNEVSGKGILERCENTESTKKMLGHQRLRGTWTNIGFILNSYIFWVHVSNWNLESVRGGRVATKKKTRTRSNKQQISFFLLFLSYFSLKQCLLSPTHNSHFTPHPRVNSISLFRVAFASQFSIVT